MIDVIVKEKHKVVDDIPKINTKSCCLSSIIPGQQTKSKLIINARRDKMAITSKIVMIEIGLGFLLFISLIIAPLSIVYSQNDLS